MASYELSPSTMHTMTTNIIVCQHQQVASLSKLAMKSSQRTREHLPEFPCINFSDPRNDRSKHPSGPHPAFRTTPGTA
ncbi:hypothetical protein DsansV1_C26g0190311 [Dioscorea sansibarensis]